MESPFRTCCDRFSIEMSNENVPFQSHIFLPRMVLPFRFISIFSECIYSVTLILHDYCNCTILGTPQWRVTQFLKSYGYHWRNSVYTLWWLHAILIIIILTNYIRAHICTHMTWHVVCPFNTQFIDFLYGEIWLNRSKLHFINTSRGIFIEPFMYLILLLILWLVINYFYYVFSFSLEFTRVLKSVPPLHISIFSEM